MLGACLSSWGLPLISTPCPIPEQRRSCAPRTIPTLFLSGVFSEIKTQGKSPHVGAGNSSDRATSRSGAPVSSLGQAPHPSHPPTHTHTQTQELRSPWSAESGEVASRTASASAPAPSHLRPARARAGAGSKLTWPEPGAGARGRRCPSAEADKLSQAPSGHRLVARLRTRGRGAASPGRQAAGGGRGRGRQGRGGRGAAWDLRRPPGAPRVLPPAPPLSPPRPASPGQ